MKRLVAALFSACLATAACAQGTIQQSGPVTVFHAPSWYGNGIIGDAGTSSVPFINSFGLFNGASCPFAVSSQTTPGVPTGQYATFSLCQTNTASTFYFQGFGGLSSPSVYFNIGGINYPFPGPGNGDVAGPPSSVSGDVACFNGTTGKLLQDCGSLGLSTVTSVTATGTTAVAAYSQIVAVKTVAASAVNLTLPASSSFPTCPAAVDTCPVITVKDVSGNAATGLIMVSAADGKLIDGAATAVMPFTLQSADYVLLGSSWAVK